MYLWLYRRHFRVNIVFDILAIGSSALLSWQGRQRKIHNYENKQIQIYTNTHFIILWAPAVPGWRGSSGRRCWALLVVGSRLLSTSGSRRARESAQWQQQCCVRVKPVTAASVTESSENCENVEQQRVPWLRVRGWILKHILSVVDDIWAGDIWNTFDKRLSAMQDPLRHISLQLDILEKKMPEAMITFQANAYYLGK